MLMQLQPPDFSRGDWWLELLLQLVTLWLLSRTRAEVRSNNARSSSAKHDPDADGGRR